MSKRKNLQVSLDIPDDKHLKHIVNAYGLVCQYRTVNKVPHEKMESWLLRLVVEGCNALYSYHNQNLLKQQETAAKAQAENVATDPATQLQEPLQETNDVSVSTDKVKSKRKQDTDRKDQGISPDPG